MPSDRIPPGPKGSWLWGSSPLQGSGPLDTLTSWARQYGDVVSWRRLHFRIYLLSHPTDIEKVLATGSRGFVKGRGLQANREALGNGLLMSEGDFWLRQRRLIQPAFSRERIVSYAPKMMARAVRMLDEWKDGETRDIHRELMRVTLAIAADTLFSVSIEHEADRVGAALGVIMDANTSPSRIFPLVRHLPTPANRRYSRAVGELDRIVYSIIAQRRMNCGTDGSTTAPGRRIANDVANRIPDDDLLSRMFNAEDQDGTRMTDRQLRDECITLLLAGHETTAIALSWTAYLLAQHPAVEERLHAEVDAALGGRLPSIEDLPRLLYAECIVRESLRLYPPAWLMPRLAVEDCDIGGYRIPKGASVLVSQWIVQRDPRYFTSPEQFDPSRWTEEFARSLPRFAYFPFGGGPRVCVGNSFAMTEAVLLLAAIAQRFRLRLTSPTPVVPLPSMTLRPKGGVRLNLSRR